MLVWWSLVPEKASFARDFLLPSPSKEDKGSKREVLLYETAFPPQNKVLSVVSVNVVSVNGTRVFLFTATQFWTPALWAGILAKRRHGAR